MSVHGDSDEQQQSADDDQDRGQVDHVSLLLAGRPADGAAVRTRPPALVAAVAHRGTARDEEAGAEQADRDEVEADGERTAVELAPREPDQDAEQQRGAAGEGEEDGEPACGGAPHGPRLLLRRRDPGRDPDADACEACKAARDKSGDPTFLCDEHLRRIYGV